jgi:signal transduction histidine kinase
LETDRDQEEIPGFEIKIFDNGSGIPREYHDRIFDEFEILPCSIADLPQTGLGLAFCKMVVEAHGGTIKVENNIPRGTIFTIRILN